MYKYNVYIDSPLHNQTINNVGSKSHVSLAAEQRWKEKH